MQELPLNFSSTSLGIEKLNPMQEQAFQTIIQEKNTLLLAPTGSGKTLAFLIPLLKLIKPETKKIQALILTPTRELALQIEQVWKKMNTNCKVSICYGGHDIQTEINNLHQPPVLLIGTPGRITDHLDRKSFALNEIKTLVLNEFDKSLQLGFHEHMEKIITNLHFLQKRILVSATSKIDIPEFTGIHNAFELNFIPKKEQKTRLSTKLIISEDKDKLNTLFELICSFNAEAALVFCNHREVSERISNYLNEMGIQSNFYHGGMDQEDRERALIQFRNGSINYLITTDLAARGLDIPEMKHVVHYQLPSKEEEFIHRNGRTARVQESGTAYLVMNRTENIPFYITNKLKETALAEKITIPPPPKYQTLYISGGKKDKLNKVDIVGFFIKEGQLNKEDIGNIDVKDFISFVAIERTKIASLLSKIKDKKMKGKKYKIEITKRKKIQDEK